ncbi:MAG: DNA mismatch repair endonuclease MutL [Treponema sp.]|nr:DNA mismatch repair endonuclease MutL [Treponema sp.]
MDNKIIRRPVKTLSPDVARKIAAGEVIDRPAAIVRELMDNAVDSGADYIEVEINGGGIDSIRISDNGIGMSKEDLIACARPHATSKIVEASDLMNLSTLGFRGEALASIAAVSRLTISSNTYRMKASLTDDHLITEIPPIQNGKGTIVQSEGLFENFPARRIFLKRPGSETLMCKEVFIEKSLPRTDISFRLTVDNEIKLDLPQNTTLAERFTSALQLKESPSLFSELKNQAEDWNFTLLIGEPSVYRNDRKHIYIYVNGRRVQEYSLIQAIEYGCQGFFPNGTHPFAALFVQINPALVDFNIHPAKKEVRFKDSSSLHHGVSTTTRNFFKSYGIKQSNEYEKNDFEDVFNDLDFSSIQKEQRFEQSSKPSTNISDTRERFFNYEKSPKNDIFQNNHNSKQNLASQALFDKPYNFDFNENIKISEPKIDFIDDNGFVFLGTALNCFLIAQIHDTIYFIDQHAAHERILFDKILSSDIEKQDLLVPYVIETNSEEEDIYLSNIIQNLSKAGFIGKQIKSGKWEFTTVPTRWKGTEQDLRNAILEKLEDPKDIIYSVAAMTACKAAVKDGYILDRKTASDLAKEALTLQDPHCPHGRPIWTTLTKEQLFARVRRTE